MYCSIHTMAHPMVGVDLHNGISATIPPAPLPFLPHIVGQLLGGTGVLSTAAISSDVASYGIPVIQRASDIGMFIPHIPTGPNILAPLLFLTSGSVCEFGAFSVQANNKPLAIAPLIQFGFNFNCYDPVMWNTNMVIAPGLNLANFTLADMIASLVSVVVDLAISAVFTNMFKLTSPITSGLVGKMCASSAFSNSIFKDLVKEGLTASVNAAISVAIGTPAGIGSNSNDYSSGAFFDQQIDESMTAYYENGVTF